MGLIRLILLLAIGYFIWLNVKVYFRKQERRQQQAAPDPRRDSITVVKCQQCHVHLPQHEAIAVDSLWFCCDEHRRQWLARFGK